MSSNIFDDDYFESAMEESFVDTLDRKVGRPLRKSAKKLGRDIGASLKKNAKDAADNIVDAAFMPADNVDRLYKNRNSSQVVLYKADLAFMPYPQRESSWNYLISFMLKNHLTITMKKSFLTRNTRKDLRAYDFIGIMNDKTNREVRHPNYEKAKRFMSFLKSNRQKLSKAESYKEFVGIITSYRI